MIYLIDPIKLMTEAKEKCPIFCGVYKPTCPLDFAHPLYGIPN